MRALFAKNHEVGLHRGWFLGYLWVNYLSLGWLRSTFDFEWPFQGFPIVAGMFFAALMYGLDAGRRGMQCGPPIKSWILARQMVLTAFSAVLAMAAFLYVFDDLRFPGLSLGAFIWISIKLLAFLAALIVICRFSFIFGVQSGYSAYLRKEEGGK